MGGSEGMLSRASEERAHNIGNVLTIDIIWLQFQPVTFLARRVAGEVRRGEVLKHCAFTPVDHEAVKDFHNFNVHRIRPCTSPFVILRSYHFSTHL